MVSNQNTARYVGTLFLLSNVTFIIGAVVLIEPFLSAPDYLSILSANRPQVITGVLLELINGLAYISIAVLLFPILKLSFVRLAIGYLVFRVIEFLMQVASDLSPLALQNLSEDFVKAGSSASSSFQALGALLLAERFWAFQMVSLTFSIGALMFYYMFYHSRLIPRFISVWGLIGATLVLVNFVFDMFGINMGSFGNLGVVMLLNELFLGGWLIIKGFERFENSPGLT